MEGYTIDIHPHDVVNPQFGYNLTIYCGGLHELNIHTHPDTGKQLTAATALDVAREFLAEAERPANPLSGPIY